MLCPPLDRKFLIMILIILASIYGLLFGSFANAVAYRVPHNETLMTRSHCPKCDAKITAWQNIPIISWIFLRGKCANCKEPISIQYPLIELLTAVIFGIIGWKVSTLDLPLFSNILTLIALCYFAFIGVVLSIIDQKTMKLPTKLIYPTLIVVFVLLGVSSLVQGDYSSIVHMCLGSVASSLFYGILWFVFPKGMGFGDVRLSLLTGAVLGWFSIGHAVLGIFLPFIVLSIVTLPLMIAGVVKRKTKLPLGPWIIASAVLTIACGDFIIGWYINLLSFL